MLLRFHFSFFILLAVGLSVEMIMASPYSENSQTVLSQKKAEELPTKTKDVRRRSECGVSPSIWTLNLCETHKFCYLASQKLQLWEPKHKRARGSKRLLIKNIQTQKKIELTWRASQETIAWPIEKMPIESGAAYLIQLKKRRVYFEREIYLYQVPNHLETAVEKMDWMTQQGCAWQVKMFQEKLNDTANE